VSILTIAEAPIERTTTFVATNRSRRSTTIQPQAEGFLTAIRVQSGQSVSPGDVMFEIDARSQQAAVASLQSVRAAREADAALARQQLQRAKTLLGVGAVSQQELEQAEAAEKAAGAQLRSIEDQIRQQQTQLAYYQVVAPTSGIVGDVPVRVGDSVMRGTVLTTVADNSGLELYINVPVQDAPRLRVGLPVRVLGERGETVASTRVSFVSPTVTDGTQTVLVKAPVGRGEAGLRADQFVRVSLVWSEDPGLTVPVVAVSRVNGQYFVFVAERGDGGTLVARQRPITVGPVIGDAYLVTGGLSAGDRLIVAGTQKIGDGAPVQELPASAAPPGGSAGRGSGREGAPGAPEGGK
jgi:RND family efflux transporter MFP subunit